MAFLYVTSDNELRSVNWDGSDDFAISSAGKVYQVTNTDNADTGQVWVLSTDPDTDPTIGGDMLMVSELDTSGTPVFTPFAKPGGVSIGAKGIAAGTNGCYYVQEDGSVHFVDKDGNTSDIFPANTALEIQKGDAGLIAVVTYEIDVDKGGNVIKWFRELPGVKPALENVGNNNAIGSQAVVQNEDQVVFMQPNGKLASFSPPSDNVGEVAFDSSAVLRLISNGGFYAVSTEMHDGGGNYIKNIENTPATKVESTKGAVYAEFTTLNTDLFK